MKVCFGIICIGTKYLQEFNEFFRPSVESYCNKYGYSLKVFDTFLDSTNKHPCLISFQKALIPTQDCMKEYDLVVILDADIYINKHAPPIHTLELNGKIGMVNELSQIPHDKREFLKIEPPNIYYGRNGFVISDDIYLNSGLIICNPKTHGPILKTIYDKYSGGASLSASPFHYEQSCIGGYLIEKNLITQIPAEWNHIYMFDKLLLRRTGNYNFMHFAGVHGYKRINHLRTFLVISQLMVGK